MNRLEITDQTNPRSPSHRSSGQAGRATRPRDRRARGRRGESLGSARDRERLRERSSAERDRVEQLLANTPPALERRARRRPPRPTGEAEASAAASSPRLRPVSPGRCPICSDARVVTDEVLHEGTLRMSECLHCEHRWTERPKARWAELGPRLPRPVRPRARRAVWHDGEPAQAL